MQFHSNYYTFNSCQIFKQYENCYIKVVLFLKTSFHFPLDLINDVIIFYMNPALELYFEVITKET
jgi:hypothetical protein